MGPASVRAASLSRAITWAVVAPLDPTDHTAPAAGNETDNVMANANAMSAAGQTG
ncbi:MAG: hypothetical protein V3V20_12040 [Algisphaera sp.]